jgi:hypothetical protein
MRRRTVAIVPRNTTSSPPSHIAFLLFSLSCLSLSKYGSELDGREAAFDVTCEFGIHTCHQAEGGEGCEGARREQFDPG